MNSKITKIIRRTTTHSYEEYPAVIDATQKMGYRIVRTIPNELSADGRESDVLVTIAERGGALDAIDKCVLDASTCEYYGDGCDYCDGFRRKWM